MLQILFRAKPSKDADDKPTEALLEPETWSPPPFEPTQIRVLLCQDTGEQNKTALFDTTYPSTANATDIKAQSNGQNAAQLARSWNGSPVQTLANKASEMLGSFTDSRRSIDARPSLKTIPTALSHDSSMSPQKRGRNNKLDLLGDMIFGTAPLSHKGMSTKIHLVRREKPQIVITKLFTVNPRDLETLSQGRRGSFSSISSDMSVASSIAGSDYRVPYNNRSRPSSVYMVGEEYSESSDDDSFRMPQPSPTFSSGPPILGLRSSRNSFNTKRMRRSSQTSLENGVFNPTPLPVSGRGDLPNAGVKHSSRSINYALAIVINCDDSNKLIQEFIFSHFALVENRMHQLQAVAFKLLCALFRRSSTQAQINGPNSGHLPFLTPYVLQHEAAFLDAVSRFKDSLCSLYKTPRIQEPLWLNMCTFPQRRAGYAQSLLKELVYLIENFDNKRKNFFVSTLITTVLMYHLSWVQTVAPPEEDTIWIHEHALNYDPLWAQLSDLYGNVGSPSRLCRTIVVGQQASIVRRILYILSYFIRCNEVYENSIQLDSSEAGKTIFGMEHEEAIPSPKERTPRQVNGSTEVKSINIPKKKNDPSSYNNTSSYMDNSSTVHTPARRESKSRPRNGETAAPTPSFSATMNKSTSKPSSSSRDSSTPAPTPSRSKATSRDGTHPLDTAHPLDIAGMLPLQPSHSLTKNPNGNGNGPTNIPPPTNANNRHRNSFVAAALAAPIMSQPFASSPPVMCDASTSSGIAAGLQKLKLNNNGTVTTCTDEAAVLKDGAEVGVVGKSVDGMTATLSELEATAKNMAPSELCMPVAMPRSFISQMIPDITQVKDTGVPAERADQLFAKSYGRSLMVGYCEQYKSDFVLMGLPGTTFVDHLESDLKESLQVSAHSDSVTQSVCILADTNTWQCQVVRYSIVDPNRQYNNGEIESQSHYDRGQFSDFVCQTLVDIKTMHTGGMAADDVGWIGRFG
ncbi:folliculin-interacting protein middle domain-containing protein [Jimgerdemannia flammicorona]|uniref:Folliculin-interacting protein middle domain-containing protein n=1 Tax=Jimgerdemannia flammicorona TaxID=994334 RepID=A0A433QCF2_9FUNG|nr:folliculin-interacting protein middle domain-containing protein [Jimgerdemannia flammicorona]